jgi:hypothetical protein
MEENGTAKTYVEDESGLPGKKIRAAIVVDFKYLKFSDASYIEEIIEEVGDFIEARLDGRPGSTIIHTDYRVDERRGDNQRVDLSKMKFRSN